MKPGTRWTVLLVLALTLSCDSSEDIVGPPPPDDQVSDAAKLSLLKQYAPLVYFDEEETFFPSSVEWSFPYLKRIRREQEYCGDCWSLTTVEPITWHIVCTVATQDFFYGNADLASVPIYAFWVEKSFHTANGFVSRAVDLVYFVYYPFNRGKYLGITCAWIVGDHVGDWECIIVRLKWRGGASGADPELRPELIYLSHHGGGETELWGGRIAIHEGTHPIVFAAQGSHGFYRGAGSIPYMSMEGGRVLYDETGYGPQWDTWNRVAAFDLNAEKGLNGTAWPTWMSDDYTDPGVGDPGNPGAGAIFRWGNPGGDPGCSCYGEWSLAPGPTGPIEKRAMNTVLEEGGRNGSFDH